MSKFGFGTPATTTAGTGFSFGATYVLKWC